MFFAVQIYGTCNELLGLNNRVLILSKHFEPHDVMFRLILRARILLMEKTKKINKKIEEKNVTSEFVLRRVVSNTDKHKYNVQ